MGLNVSLCRLIIGEGLISRSRDAILGHQILGKLLARLDLCRRLRGAKDEQTVSLKGINNTCRQSRLGANNRQIYLLVKGNLQKTLNICILHRKCASLLCDTGITGCAENFTHFRRARERIDYGVFTAATTYN